MKNEKIIIKGERDWIRKNRTPGWDRKEEKISEKDEKISKNKKI